ncbi:unnamed protein product [Paramecium sonneborni]|uniref:Uncharacterized protein n=1 Tax=Paramecium sonneborni TaxID=65129 RepID=A0A8S1KD94_9CILI|nr:unnamed protein product [Paramecium sonneborni]
MKGNSQQSNSIFPLQGFFYCPFGIIDIQAYLRSLIASQYMLENKDDIKVKQEIKEEYESESIQKVCKKNIQKFTPYIYPGETKNYYKNIGKKLSSYIINNFDQTLVKQDQVIMKFLKIDGQNYNRNHFKELLNSKMATKIAKNFFGNFMWCSLFIEQNKTDIDLYFRHNQQIFRRKKRQ